MDIWLLIGNIRIYVFVFINMKYDAFHDIK